MIILHVGTPSISFTKGLFCSRIPLCSQAPRRDLGIGGYASFDKEDRSEVRWQHGCCEYCNIVVMIETALFYSVLYSRCKNRQTCPFLSRICILNANNADKFQRPYILCSLPTLSHVRCMPFYASLSLTRLSSAPLPSMRCPSRELAVSDGVSDLEGQGVWSYSFSSLPRKPVKCLCLCRDHRPSSAMPTPRIYHVLCVGRLLVFSLQRMGILPRGSLPNWTQDLFFLDTALEKSIRFWAFSIFSMASIKCPIAGMSFTGRGGSTSRDRLSCNCCR